MKKRYTYEMELTERFFVDDNKEGECIEITDEEWEAKEICKKLNKEHKRKTTK